MQSKQHRDYWAIINDFLAWKRDRSLPPRLLISVMAMAGLFLNPTSLPSEHPALSDSQSSAQGGHVMGRGGADDVTTMAGMRVMRLRCCQWSREGTLQCWCQQVLIGCSDGAVLDMVVMAMLGIIMGKGGSKASYLT